MNNEKASKYTKKSKISILNDWMLMNDNNDTLEIMAIMFFSFSQFISIIHNLFVSIRYKICRELYCISTDVRS